MPLQIAAHTQATIYGIAEKVLDLPVIEAPNDDTVFYNLGCRHHQGRACSPHCRIGTSLDEELLAGLRLLEQV